MKRKKLSIKQLIIVIVLGLMVLAPMAVSADSPNPKFKIWPVDTNPYGLSYGDWSAKWWQWAFSMPVDHHPLFDTADCSTGQTGEVWFLGASFSSTQNPNTDEYQAIAIRKCKIPAGKAVFFPVANVEASTIEDNGHGFHQLLASAKGFQDTFTITSAEVDGISIDLNNYRVQSQLFTFGPLPNDNVLQFLGVEDATEGTTSDSVADGVYLMVTPLSLGNHKIHFHAKSPDFNFMLDITYNLLVVPADSLT
jgi:hypothetical protein